MKSLFLFLLGILILFSQIMVMRSYSGDGVQRIPVLTWVTGINPVREEQISLYYRWLSNRGLPEVKVRLDINNGGPQRTIVQSVSGVAGDLIDVGNGWIWFYKEMGVATAVNDLEARFGYPDAERFHAASSEFMSGSNQYAFPCNVSASGLVFNLDTLAAHGIQEPPTALSVETFVSMATEFTKRANRGLPRQKHFFVDTIPLDALRHSMGISWFNETLTASALRLPESVKALELIFDWTYHKHFMPTLSETQSFIAEDGYGGPTFQLWNRGVFAGIQTGRWMLIEIRQLKKNPNCSFTTLPYVSFPYAPMQSRCIMVYKGTKHLEAAKSFIAYLRSPEYNQSIVSSLDSLPPNPKYMDSEAFLRPVGYTNEWKLHGGTREVALQYGFSREYSPFCLTINYLKKENKLLQSFMSRVQNAEDTVKAMDKALNFEIQDYVKRHEDIQESFKKAKERQLVIDAFKKRGEPIPAELIDNVFLKSIYLKDGRAK